MIQHRILAILGSAPLSLDKARKHLNIIPDQESPPSHPDDDVITDAINDATTWAERFTGRALTSKRYEAFLDAFPCPDVLFRLPFAAPLKQLESVKYLDQDGAEQTLAPDQYVVLDHLMPASFQAAPGVTFPATSRQSGCVRVVYTAGYDDTNKDLFPPDVMRAIKQVTAEFFENREDATPLNVRPVSFTSQNLLQPSRLYHRNAT